LLSIRNLGSILFDNDTFLILTGSKGCFIPKIFNKKFMGINGIYTKNEGILNIGNSLLIFPIGPASPAK